MTNITELAQSLKAAADREMICLDGAETSEIWERTVTPENILALVEALEKAQTINAAAEKLVRCKGRYHSEQNYRALAALFGVKTPDLPPLDSESRTATAAAADVLAERKRQVTAEGWTPGHDDEYEHGELADAAGCYALSSELFDCAGEPPRPWPWPDEWWKPTNRRRDLVKAGALILAEIERLDRAAGIKVEAE
ncbi:hypothetical protein [Klebsiella pneumoniae]|uniref:hypothetical protein n=1 Tax=Klebsiella pneumoniae TaxID=573 RepID=UPI000A71DE12|nr:hypothetical protein [Klebsiella pneumoniae]